MNVETWHDALTAWVNYMRASKDARGTVRLRLYHLRRIVKDLGSTHPDDVTFDQLVDWIAVNGQGWKPNTIRSYRASLRHFYGWAKAASIVDHSPAHMLPKVKVPRALPRPTPEAAFRQALSDAHDSERSLRAIKLAGWCGLRRFEIARVRREDVEPALDGGHVLIVTGKGDHVRAVPLPDALARDLLACPPGWIFPSPHRPGHLTAHHLGKTIAAYFPEGLTTHNLRHRCGTVAYRGSLDLRAVQELLGHAKPETTALYTEVEQTAIRAAMLAAAA